jgi:hypothetical protein
LGLCVCRDSGESHIDLFDAASLHSADVGAGMLEQEVIIYTAIIFELIR